MFTVGDFAGLPQVSKRLPRYYEEIGLLKPNPTDRLTGYGYYSAEIVRDLTTYKTVSRLEAKKKDAHRASLFTEQHIL